MPEVLDYWLGDLSSKFNENKGLLKQLDFEKEYRLDNEIRNFIKEHPSAPGHDFSHHSRVRTFTTIIGTVNNIGTENIQICRYGAVLHDHLKEAGRGGKGDHNWSELRKLTKKLMESAKIDGRYLPKVIGTIEEHEIDNPSKRNEIGNILYEGDTVDITFLPRCFDVAQKIEEKRKGTYDRVDKFLIDYLSYQVNPSTPITSAGRRMFDKGKTWSISTLQKLKERLGDNDSSQYFNFLGTKWECNQTIAPENLREILASYNKNLPNYTINLQKLL